MPRPTPPTGFILLGLMLAALGAGFVLGVVWSDERWLPRFIGVAVAVLSFLVAEALWWMRPWLGRAINVWTLACPLALIAAELASEAQYEATSMGNVVVVVARAILFVGMPCVLARGYVRGHVAAAGLLSPRPSLPQVAP